jgi:hypothetical protein
MNKIIFVALLCLVAAPALSHPGKTDRYGGHNCIKDCEEWKLYYKEYHLHDKDGKAIRVAGKPGKKRKTAELKSAPTETLIVIDHPQSVQTVTVYQVVRRVNEENPGFNPLLFVLLVLLLLLLIIRMSREREKEKGRERRK